MFQIMPDGKWRIPYMSVISSVSACTPMDTAEIMGSAAASVSHFQPHIEYF